MGIDIINLRKKIEQQFKSNSSRIMEIRNSLSQLERFHEQLLGKLSLLDEIEKSKGVPDDTNIIPNA